MNLYLFEPSPRKRKVFAEPCVMRSAVVRAKSTRQARELLLFFSHWHNRCYDILVYDRAVCRWLEIAHDVEGKAAVLVAGAVMPLPGVPWPGAEDFAPSYRERRPALDVAEDREWYFRARDQLSSATARARANKELREDPDAIKSRQAEAPAVPL